MNDYSPEERAKLIRRSVQFDIDALERKQLRVMRELIIGDHDTALAAGDRLRAIEAQIAEKRKDLA